MKKLYHGAWSVHDPIFLDDIKNFSQSRIDTKDFIYNYKQWFVKGIEINGIENFTHLDFCNGTTEAFSSFYHKFANRRLRLMKGEYYYHQIMSKTLYENNFAWIDEDSIRDGDVFVLSCPFSDTGNVPENIEHLLECCEVKHVPVLIDMAYINISKIKKMNFKFKCIDTITTSLSKVFPVEHHRIGIRLRQNFYDDPIFAYNQTDYVNKYSIAIGQYFIEKYDNDFLYKKFSKQPKQMCQELDLEESDCVIFGIDAKSQYNEYSRGGNTNRLCFSRVWDKRIKQ